MMYGDPDVEYTKCPECGEWNGNHLISCIVGLRADYVEGRIELEDFEAALETVLA